MYLRASRFLLAAAALSLSAGADAQFKQSAGYRMMDAVRKKDNAELNKVLSEPGTTVVNYRDPTSGDGALHVVIRRHDSDDMMYLRFLLQHGADANQLDGKGNPPLLLAVDSSFSEAIPLLLRYRANINLGNSKGETPLIHAVQKRDLELVRTLLAAGADPDKSDVIAGRSARDYANADTRAPELAKVIGAVPKRERRAVSGPKL